MTLQTHQNEPEQLVGEAIRRRDALVQWQGRHRLLSSVLGNTEGFPVGYRRMAPFPAIQTREIPLTRRIRDTDKVCSEALGDVLRPCWYHHSRPPWDSPVG